MRFIFVGSHFIPVVEKGEGSKRCCCGCQASASASVSEPAKKPEVRKGILAKEELPASLEGYVKISFHPGSMVAEEAPAEGVTEEALTEEELQHIYNKLAAGDMSVLHEGDSAESDSLLSLVEQKLREALKPECQNLRVNTLDILIRLWAVIKESSKE